MQHYFCMFALKATEFVEICLRNKKKLIIYFFIYTNIYAYEAVAKYFLIYLENTMNIEYVNWKN